MIQIPDNELDKDKCMKKILLISVLFCLTLLTMAQSAALSKANEQYAAGEYESAARLYEDVLASEGVSPELYYNLGNAYYKANEVGRSILNYERALRLSPMFDDARVNLEMAQQKVVDNIVQAPTFFLGRWIENLIKLLSSNQWFYTSIVLFVLALACAFLFIFGRTRMLRKSSFYTAIVLGVLVLISFVFAGVRKDQLVNHREAVVMSGVVTVKSSPDRSGTDLFKLHEGTKVSIKSTLGEWVEIKLGNGSIGWLELENIEKI